MQGCARCRVEGCTSVEGQSAWLSAPLDFSTVFFSVQNATHLSSFRSSFSSGDSPPPSSSALIDRCLPERDQSGS